MTAASATSESPAYVDVIVRRWQLSPAAPQSIKPPVNRSTSVPTARTKTHRERQVARKAFAANDTVREKVRYLAGLGVRQDDIAKIIGCAPKTLRKRLRDELDLGIAEANATVSGYLFAAAKAGNIAAIIFWLKTRAHWRESTPPDDQSRTPRPRRTHRWSWCCLITIETPI